MRVKIKSIKGLLAVLAISILTITSGCTEQGTNLEKSSSSSVQENVNKEVSSSSTSASDMEQTNEKKVSGVTKHQRHKPGSPDAQPLGKYLVLQFISLMLMVKN